MHTGMLWFDSTQTTLDNKIKKAAEYYQKKYGRASDRSMPRTSKHDARFYSESEKDHFSITERNIADFYTLRQFGYRAWRRGN